MTREYAYPQAPDLGPASLACVDVFGQSVMQRTINRLERAGVRATSVITTPDCVAFSANKNVAITITEKPADRWCAAERTLKKEAQRGVDTFLIAELGAYVELDLQDALRFHKAKGQPITCIHDSHGPLCFWLVDAAQVIASGKFPFPLDEEELEHPPIPYLVDAHVNRLSDAREFRQFLPRRRPQRVLAGIEQHVGHGDDQSTIRVLGFQHRVELLQKLLRGEIKNRLKRNVVQGRSFADLLEASLRRYQNRAIETAKVIEELIQLAKDMRAANARGEALKLSEDELAFYDALEVNDSAVKVLGEPTLAGIARELVATVKKNVTIDWTLRENVRAQLRVIVKRILRKYGYPPDKQEKATQLVLEQAEVLSGTWVGSPA